MKIKDVVCSAGRTGFYFDDQRAIKNGAINDGSTYIGKPVTEGFTRVRQSGESISVMIILEDNQIALGDCAAVQYSGAGGRDPLFLAKDFIPIIDKVVAPKLIGREITSFKELCDLIENIMVDNKKLHTAIRYGVTQALLDTVAKSNNILMCQVIAKEYNTQVLDKIVPIFTQSGDNRYENADKMIIKGAQVLPHALINNVSEKLGYNGEKLEEYVAWLRDRIINLRDDNSYNPIIHIDVYGTLGVAFGNDNYEKIVSYMEKLCHIAKPFKLRIEGPVDVEDREKQMLALREIRKLIDERNINVEIVADEWCNTLEDIKYFADNKAGHIIQIKTPDLGGINNVVEAVLYCKDKNIGAYQGGTCNETDNSAKTCAHIAMASGPDQILAKPGMGVDEGYMIVYNEMQRILALNKVIKN
ncbi:methylaspartate ammonia-lyase [Terrisporobacter mayombei]|uniref:methylaspartate ammonia-lyase n=1 Tax=Terrisporobacter mayombei TaxID=1541 RepID=A0ABY9PZY7_9FIRM|nr:methylaspartate ammonia-lyase [Terrisporobacter mayombei]MCC3868411.1 methylaspartate ammonia-lyase [Terrisporobacter mayombei]WMT80559.1 Methylaspartate ammonia-lyase [Terrisporobacter mayombei]